MEANVWDMVSEVVESGQAQRVGVLNGLRLK